MDKLIEALQILKKYGDSEWPTHCDHEVFMVPCVKPEAVSDADAKRLKDLGFFIYMEYDPCWASFHFGRC